MQLKTEDFVTILPRRKAVINTLTARDIKNYYEIIGVLKSIAILKAYDRLQPQDFDYMEQLNREMKEAIEADKFDPYYEKKLAFHNVYPQARGNEKLMKIVNNLKKRLYDFPRPAGLVKEWEQASSGEHARLTEYLRQGDREGAA